MRSTQAMNIVEVLRLAELGLSYREIARGAQCSKTTVSEIIKKSKNKNIDYKKAVEMGVDAITAAFYEKYEKVENKNDEINWEEINKRLVNDKNLNLQYIWQEEYKPSHPEGYSYSFFCEKYRAWKRKNTKEISMVQSREPGKEMFIDWMGDTLDCVYNSESNTKETAHFFITTLGVSSYPFVEAFRDETENSWIKGHLDAFDWYGGIPKILIPDNCRTAVNVPNLYEPNLNSAYRALGVFYNVGIIPARVRRPKDKGSVESCVGWLETWLLQWLKGRIFTSFELLNNEIKKRIIELSEKDFQKKNGSRKSIFLEFDKINLRPLPKDKFCYFETKLIKKVPDNYHVEFKKFFYSVPYMFVGESVTIHAYENKIEIFNSKFELIAFHVRSYSGKEYITNKNHMPIKHRISKEISEYTDEDYKNMSKELGDNIYKVILKILDSHKIKEVSYRSCLGILNLSKKYGVERLENACKKALYLQSCTYTTIDNILKNNLENQYNEADETPTPEHENLRTSEWK